MDWSTTVLVFPGQGSQQVGMGKSLVEQFPAAAELFAQADQILGTPFSTLMFEGPAETLDDTLNTQPALYITGIATLRAMESLHGAIKPQAVAGHSLGEFTALTAAGALGFEDGLRLVRERGRLMKEAGQRNPGAMAALLGAEIADVRALCAAASAQAGKPVVLANDNCPGQVVISGDETALDLALTLAKERGIKRALKLAVSIAAHSPLMESATAEFRQILDSSTFAAPSVPVIGNLTVAPLRTPDEIRAELGAQLTGSVRWTETIQSLRQMGATTFLELGSKDALTGMLKRIDKEATGVAVNTADVVRSLT
ncbi:MAG: ACP S-malonyltransferase [Anaerolineae bacterium]|nr:ACP S-malonyltransferase [Anaerolineae bacterium]